MGIRWEPGRRYRRLGVLKADAKTSSGRPLFLANAQTIEKAKAAIATHRENQTRAQVNLQELSHVAAGRRFPAQRCSVCHVLAMKFFTGTADGIKCKVSQAKRLVLLEGDGQDIVKFAVMGGKYLAASGCPYIALKSKNIALTVDIEGHNTPQKNSYDIFEKTAVSLPNTCIEAAEHALKSMFRGFHSRRRIKDGEGAEICMQLGNNVKFDIDDEDMNEKSFEFFKGKGSAADAKTELFRPGEGMALVYSKSEKSREEGEWKVHAVAIVLMSQDPFDRFMIVEEEFSADEEDKKVKMAKTWNLIAFCDAIDFASTYQQIMPASKYKLWKLTAS